jgi:hypothetical protein
METKVNYSDMTTKELYKIASGLGVKNYVKLSKEQLIAEIEDKNGRTSDREIFKKEEEQPVTEQIVPVELEQPVKSRVEKEESFITLTEQAYSKNLEKSLQRVVELVGEQMDIGSINEETLDEAIGVLENALSEKKKPESVASEEKPKPSKKPEGGRSLESYVAKHKDSKLTPEQILELDTKREKVIACWFSGIQDIDKISEIAIYAKANVRGILKLSKLV